MTLINKRTTTPMPGFFDSFLLKDMLELPEFSAQRARGSMPAVNIKETAQGFELEMMAPGLDKNDFSIEIDKNILTISSVNKEENKNNEEEKKAAKFFVQEFNLRPFKRSFKLPDNIVDAEKIEAAYTHGILKLSLPKKEEVKLQPKQIKIA